MHEHARSSTHGSSWFLNPNGRSTPSRTARRRPRWPSSLLLWGSRTDALRPDDPSASGSLRPPRVSPPGSWDRCHRRKRWPKIAFSPCPGYGRCRDVDAPGDGATTWHHRCVSVRSRARRGVFALRCTDISSAWTGPIEALLDPVSWVPPVLLAPLVERHPMLQLCPAASAP